MNKRAFLPGLLLSALSLSGCYAHAPVQVGEVQPGTPVRVRISGAEAERLAEVLGDERRVLRGNVVEQQGGGLLVRVPGMGSSTAQPLAQQVLLEPSSILELEIRRLDRRRSAGLTAALAVAGGYLMWSQFANGQQVSGDDKPGPNEVLIPVLRR